MQCVKLLKSPWSPHPSFQAGWSVGLLSPAEWPYSCWSSFFREALHTHRGLQTWELLGPSLSVFTGVGVGLRAALHNGSQREADFVSRTHWGPTRVVSCALREAPGLGQSGPGLLEVFFQVMLPSFLCWNRTLEWVSDYLVPGTIRNRKTLSRTHC